MATEKRLIDANAVVKNLEYEIENLCQPVPDSFEGLQAFIDRVVPKLLRDVINYIKRCPTVDAKEVVHGRWIVKEEPIPWCEDDVDIIWVCSVCNYGFPGESNYCPNCGAKMDGDGNG